MTHRLPEIPIEGNALAQFRNRSLPADSPGDDTSLGFTLNLLFSPIVIKQEGMMRVRMIRGDTMIRLGSLIIRVHPPATERPS